MNIRKSKIALALTGVLFMAMPLSSAFAHEDHCEIKETQLGETMKHMKSELRAYVKSFKKEDTKMMQQHLDELLKLSDQAAKETPVKIKNMQHEQMMANSNMHAMQDEEMKDMDHDNMGESDMQGMMHKDKKDKKDHKDKKDKAHASMKAMQDADMDDMDHSNMSESDMKKMMHGDKKDKKDHKDKKDKAHANMKAMKDADKKEMDQGNMGMSDMEGMDHDMANMPSMEGMTQQQHHQHMMYSEGITKLQALFKELEQTKDKAKIKAILGKIKEHSKKSHQQFRQDCD